MTAPGVNVSRKPAVAGFITRLEIGNSFKNVNGEYVRFAPALFMNLFMHQKDV